MVPADAFTAGAAARAIAGEPEYVWITGRRLEVTLDSGGRPVDATVYGPLDGRGAYTVTGERLTLDFRQGRHSLLGREGVRATIRRTKKPGAPGFFAESPRMDMEGDSQTLTLQGGGEVVIDGAPTGLQSFGAKEPVKTSSDGLLRLTATDSVKITPARVTFLGDVKAKGEGKDPWSLDADRLDVDLGETREPVRMSATGTVVFSMPGRLEGNAHALRFSETTRVLELDGSKDAPAVLDFAGGHFEAAWIKCNVQTCLVDAGPGLLSTPKTARQRVRPR
jgi:lipopolysaccharide export system protein LptA